MTAGDDRTVSPITAVVLWAAAYALVLSLARAFVLWVFGTVEADAAILAGSALRIPGHLLGGALIASLMFVPRFSHFWAFPLVVLGVVFDLFCDHYEAMLSELPGPELLGYLAQTPHIYHSIESQSHPIWWVLEILAVCALLGVLAHVLARRSLPRPGKSVRAVVGAAGLVCLLFVILAHAWPSMLPPGLRWSARMPVVWILASRPPASSAATQPVPQVHQLRRLQRTMGIRPPFASGDPRAPLCGENPRSARRSPSARSVILVVLESVGVREMRAQVDGEPLLPHLTRMASEGFSSGRMFAAGTQTCQSLTALYSGQPAQPWDVVHWRHPLPGFAGLPATLVSRGYETAYFHGAGLSFEQKRDFLSMVGIRTFFELDGRVDEPTYGWGWSDAYTLEHFQGWIEEHVESRPDVPFLAVWATLSAHHPYELPASWQRRFETDGGKRNDFHETLRYTDHQLGLLHDWYVEHELPRGTYLVVTSDHAPLYDNTLAIARGQPLRFDVPFVVLGPREEIASYAPYENRLASQMDVPATIGGLVGVHPGRCDQGLDLLGDPWPDERIVAGVGGRDLDEIHLFDPAGQARYSRRLDRLTWLDDHLTPGPPPAGAISKMRAFLELFLPVTRYLLEADAYFPGDAKAPVQ